MKKILLVDDDKDFLIQKKFELEQEEYLVETCSESGEAIEHIKRFTPDLVILDLIMEEQDSGFVLSYLIKKENRELPIIMVTSVTQLTGIDFQAIMENEREWIKADIILTKPVRTDQLVSEIKRMVKD
ncbi:MAG: response regulator [Oligoflexia bacterium]|nr:response regulator [Oligoflexia bacterium]